MVELEDTGLTFATEVDLERLQALAAEWLQVIGEDPGREGLLKTPERVAKAWAFLTRGYRQRLEEVVGGAVFPAEGSEMVVVKGVEFYSMCEHHMLPFYGKMHVAYLPNQKVIGLSKIPRIVDMFARRLQVQERLTTDVAGAIETVLRPKGVAVVAEAIHLCMMMRGVEKQNSFAITSSLRGTFESDPKTRSEFIELIRHRKESFA